MSTTSVLSVLSDSDNILLETAVFISFTLKNYFVSRPSAAVPSSAAIEVVFDAFNNAE